MPGLLRINDPDIENNKLELGLPPEPRTVFADVIDMPVARLGELVTSSGIKVIDPVSPDVFADGLAVARIGDEDHVALFVVGSTTVAANTETGAGAVIDMNVPVASDGTVRDPPPNMQPVLDPVYVTANTGPKYGKPYITNAEASYYEKDDQESSAPLPQGAGVLQKTEGEDDPVPPPATGTPVHSCPDINSLPDDFNWISEPPTAAWLSPTGYGGMHGLTAYDNSFPSFQDWSQSFQLSDHYTIYDLTMHTAVSRYKFTNTVNQLGSDNLTQKQTMVNLCYHANVILESLLAQYGGDHMVITSGFRSLAGSSQHSKGQATDIQFLSFHGSGQDTGQLYFNRAQEIKAMFNFDQLILEWFGKNPWIHISSNPAGHRHQVLTQVSSNSYQPGLILLK